MTIEIRELIRQKRHRGDFGKGPEYGSRRQTLIVYRNELARALLSERETAGKCTATIWTFPRVIVPPGVKSGQSAPYNYPTLVTRDEGGIKTRSMTTGSGLYKRNREQRFRRGDKDRRRRRIRPSHCHCQRLNFQKVIPFDPDIRPDRIRFGEVTDILGKVNTRKACGTDHITNKIIRYLIPTLHIILQDLLTICVFHGYHPRAWKRSWALMAHKPSKRRSDPCSYRPISLLCCPSKVFETIMTKRLMSWAENTDKLPTEQSGFRKHHSTNDKLFELTQAVCQAQRLSRCVTCLNYLTLVDLR